MPTPKWTAAAYRRVRKSINIGIAVDVAGKDGSRSLTVPNIKSAEQMNFADFAKRSTTSLRGRAAGKLTIADFEGTTVSLTNPGTVGTNGSIPRLMSGQGAIIATGAIDYPPEYGGVSEEMRAYLGLQQGDDGHLHV